jgi:hypothetical protein
MDYSSLAFQGYLEKTGLSIPEAEYVAKHASFSGTSYLLQVAEMMSIVGKKEAKAEASRNICLTNIISEDKQESFIFMKAFISVISYQFGDEADLEQQLTYFSDKDECAPVLQDKNMMIQIKEQFIASKTVGSRKSIWSKFLG